MECVANGHLKEKNIRFEEPILEHIHIVAMPPFEGVKKNQEFRKKIDLHVHKLPGSSDAWLHGCSLVLLPLGHGLFT